MDDCNDSDLRKWLEPDRAVETGRTLRDQLREVTTRQLGRQRQLRIVRGAAACLLFYVAGMGSLAVLQNREAEQVIFEILRQPSTILATATAMTVSPPIERDPDIPIFVVERMAKAAQGAAQAKLYRLAGNRYWDEQADLQAAMRCYRLSLVDKSSLEVEQVDNWLVVALKRALQEERSHARIES